MKLILAFAFLFILISGCVSEETPSTAFPANTQATTPVSPPSNDATTSNTIAEKITIQDAPLIPGYTLYEDKENGFHFQYPSEWSKGYHSGLPLSFISQEKKEMISVLTMKGAFPSPDAFDKYMKALIGLAEKSSEYTSFETQTTTLTGSPATIMIFEQIANNRVSDIEIENQSLPLKSLQVYSLVNDELSVVLEYKTLEENYNEETIQLIMNSFRVT